MNLRELFHQRVATAAPEDTLRSVAETMEKQGVGAVVVVRQEQVVGIVTDRDIALAVTTEKARPESPVSDVMTRQVVTIWDDQGIFNATQYMLGGKFRRLPIVDRDNRLVGMVTLDDLFVLLTRELANLGQAVAPSLTDEYGMEARAARDMAAV